MLVLSGHRSANSRKDNRVHGRQMMFGLPLDPGPCIGRERNKLADYVCLSAHDILRYAADISQTCALGKNFTNDFSALLARWLIAISS